MSFFWATSFDAVKLAFAAYAVTLAMAQSQPGALRTYQDPKNRFQFAYPAEFGTPLLALTTVLGPGWRPFDSLIFFRPVCTRGASYWAVRRC